MQNIFVLSHASDIDGVGSAALIKTKYSIPAGNLFFSDYSKQGLGYVDGKLRGRYRNGVTLFIADLGVNDAIIPSYSRIISNVKRHGGKVYWFDHHPWSDDAIKRLASRCDAAIVGENERYCATEITYRELGFSDAFTKKFVKIVHYSDFNITPKSKSDYRAVGIYALSITAYNISESWGYKTKKLRHIADTIAKGRLFDSAIKRDAKKFDKTNKERTGRMVKGLITRGNFAIGFSKHIQSTYACGAVIDASKKPVGIYINIQIGRGHIRSTGPDISKLARSLGGGGHPRASGFDIDRKKFNGFKSAKDRERLADYIGAKFAENVSF